MAVNYIVYGFSNYYPGGGMNDCRLKTSRKAEAKAFVENWKTVEKGQDYEHLQVYDVKKDRVIFEAEFYVRDYLDKDARELKVKVDEF